MHVRWIALGITLLVLGLPIASEGQQFPLTDEDITAAIEMGRDKPKRMKGLDMRDQASIFAGEATGFSLEIYTPTTWVAQLAANATRSFLDFSAADLNEEDLQPVLRVVVHPNMPRKVTADGMRQAASVEHVVIRDEKRESAIQPILLEPFGAEAANAMGASVELVGVTAMFDIEEVRSVRGADGDGEFFITIVSENGQDKDFKVKKKHFKDLP